MFILLRLIINAVALLITAWIVPGIHLGAAGPHPTKHDWTTLLIVALIFGVLNAVIRPILILLSLPLEIITLGLFTLSSTPSCCSSPVGLHGAWVSGSALMIPPRVDRGAHHFGRQLCVESRALNHPL